MAGSYNHVVEKPSGKLLQDIDICGMLECRSGDVAEAVEEMYGMIWFLAGQVSRLTGDEPGDLVWHARDHYRDGLTLSPGRAEEGALEDPDDV